MQSEISNGTMLGIVLIALAVIIALGFGIFQIAKGTANEGVTKVQTNLTNVQASEFNDYDQTIVTGTQVKSALSNFEGKPVAILISTAAWSRVGDGTGDYTGFAGSATPADKGMYVVSIGDEDDGKSFINYNAVLANAEAEGDSPVESGVAGEAITYQNGKYLATGGFLVEEGGKIVFYNNIGDMNKSGMTEYINPGSKFNSSLIVDSSGTPIGILFEQLGSSSGSSDSGSSDSGG